ncbi:MAG: OstA-like protein [Bacteroidota bacterium]|nr:OstA-like protein [Bacteroidota bacterium]
MSRFRALLVRIALFSVTPLFLAHGQGSALVTVEHADSLVARQVEGVSYRELMGNVRIRQGNVRITCDRAVQNITGNDVELIGNVTIIQDTLTFRTPGGMYDGDNRTAWSTRGVYLHDGHTTLRADAGRYDTRSRTAHFRSNVVVEEPQAVIRSETLVYERNGSCATAMGNVQLDFTGENAVVKADTVVHWIDRRISVFTGAPVLWQIDTVTVRRDTTAGDTTRIDTTSIRARRLEARRDSSNVYTALDSVEIVRGDMAGRCGEAVFLRNDSLIILRHEPVLWYGRTQGTGDSVTITLEGGEVRLLELQGHAFAHSESVPGEEESRGPPDRYDQAKGKIIRMYFSGGELVRIVVEGTAESVYYLYEGRDLNGVRRETAERIVLEFSGGTAETVRSTGGVEGIYYPEKYVTGRENAYNLEGFAIRTDRPVQPRYPKGVENSH